MSFRQYVGARYVPKLDGTWSATKDYEPLTVVDDANGNSYTSKKPVPAGTPLDNREYWALTGQFSGAILALQARVSACEDKNNAQDGEIANIGVDIQQINGEIANVGVELQQIDELLGENIILIGDSVAVGDQARPSFSDLLEVSFPNLKTFAENGAGWAKQVRYITQLQKAASSATVNNNTVSKIVVAAGFNDGTSGQESENRAAIEAFVSYAKINFPNATIHCIDIAWMKDSTRRASVLSTIIPTWDIAAEYGCAVSHIGKYVLHKYDTDFVSDGFHPSVSGNAKIAKGVASILMGGDAKNISSKYGIGTTVTLQGATMHGGGNTFDVWECYLDGQLSLRLPNGEIVFNEAKTREDNIAVGTADFTHFDAIDHNVSPTLIPVMVTGGGYGSNVGMGAMYVYVKNGTFYIRMICEQTTYSRVYLRQGMTPFIAEYN